METVKYYVGPSGWPHGSVRGISREEFPCVLLPRELHGLMKSVKDVMTRIGGKVDYSFDCLGIMADWLEENRDLLYSLNPGQEASVDQMTERMRSEWSLYLERTAAE